MQASNELILSADFDRKFLFYHFYTEHNTIFAVKGFFLDYITYSIVRKGGKHERENANGSQTREVSSVFLLFFLHPTVLGKLFLRCNKFGQKRWEIYWTAKYFYARIFYVFRDLLSTCVFSISFPFWDVRTQTNALSACN